MSLFWLIVFKCDVATDIQAHAEIARNTVSGQLAMPVVFLYFSSLAVLTGFSKNLIDYHFAAIALLGVAVAAKYYLTKQFFEDQSSTNRRGIRHPSLLAVCMIFVFANPRWLFTFGKPMYLGQLTPNVWHNSTVIAVMPFSILLFIKAYRLVHVEAKDVTIRDVGTLSCLVAVNAAIKPSFLFTLVPTVFTIIFIKIVRKEFKGRLFFETLPYFFAIFLIAIQHFAIYSSSPKPAEPSRVVIAPFKVWSSFTSNIWASVATSLLFPISYIVLTRSIWRSKLFQFALLNWLFAIIIWILFAEEGKRSADGNFYWQIVIGTYLIFLTLLSHFAYQTYSSKRGKFKRNFLIFTFFLHLSSGLTYLVKILVLKTYS
jgi:hypothetical protein